MDVNFTGKVALITGAGNGIGRATTLAGSAGLSWASSEWIIRVSTGPGQTALTRMPWRATSPAAVLVKPMTACFEAT